MSNENKMSNIYDPNERFKIEGHDIEGAEIQDVLKKAENLNMLSFGLAKIFKDKYVIIRTNCAGVHFGILEQFDKENNQALLRETRRIYFWKNAFTLTGVSMYGISDESKLTATAPVIFIPNVIEILPCSEKSAKILKEIKEHFGYEHSE